MRYRRLDSSDSSMTYSTGVSTPERSAAAFSRKATVRSFPGMNSSTRTPAGKRASCFSTKARSRARSSMTDSCVIPFDDPSKFGFTITGQRQPSSLSWPISSRNCPRGEMTPCSVNISLVSDLSSVTASTQASEPVYGNPSSSNRAG